MKFKYYFYSYTTPCHNGNAVARCLRKANLREVLDVMRSNEDNLIVNFFKKIRKKDYESMEKQV